MKTIKSPMSPASARTAMFLPVFLDLCLRYQQMGRFDFDFDFDTAICISSRACQVPRHTRPISLTSSQDSHQTAIAEDYP